MESINLLIIGLVLGAFVGVLTLFFHLLCTKYKRRRERNRQRLTLALDELAPCDIIKKQTLLTYPLQIVENKEFNFRNCKTKNIILSPLKLSFDYFFLSQIYTLLNIIVLPFNRKFSEERPKKLGTKSKDTIDPALECYDFPKEFHASCVIKSHANHLLLLCYGGQDRGNPSTNYNNNLIFLSFKFDSKNAVVYQESTKVAPSCEPHSSSHIKGYCQKIKLCKIGTLHLPPPPPEKNIFPLVLASTIVQTLQTCLHK